MEIRVRSVYPVRKELRVRFSCEYGAGDGRWTGRTPKPDEPYQVEIDLPTPLQWGLSIRPILESSPLIATTIEGIRLVAQLESVEPDGVAVLRFGPTRILADAYGEPPAPGTWVQVRTADLVLYPH